MNTSTKKTSKSKNEQTTQAEFHEFFVEQMKDIYWAEQHLIKGLQKMAGAATSLQLKKAFEKHYTESQKQICEVEQIFELLGEKPSAKRCAAMAGLLEEAEEMIQDTERNSFVRDAGLLDYLYLGVKLGIYPCLIFVGVGAMTDFGPLIANPKSFLLGAAAQIGIFLTFIGAYALGFAPNEAGSIGIIGGADGPTAIYLTSMLAPELLGPIAVAAYSYMALVPVIQPPIMRALTTKKERNIKMSQLRPVSKTEKILFPLIIAVIIALLLPSAAPLIGCLMLGNLMKECGVVDRLSKTVQNELMNIVVIFLGLTVGATATAEAFLNFRTLGILLLGVIAFAMGTAGGVLLAKVMNLFAKEGNKINPLIGSAGVSAVPMAARVSQTEGQKENPGNYLLMHAMGPNVAGVVGSAVAAGILLSFLG